MSNMTTITVPGIVHGQTISLAQPTGLTDGQSVRVTIETVAATEQWGEGIKRCAGKLADSWTEEDDRILEQIALDRKRPSNRKLPE